MDKKNKDNPLVQSDDDYNLNDVKNADISCFQKVFFFTVLKKMMLFIFDCIF